MQWRNCCFCQRSYHLKDAWGRQEVHRKKTPSSIGSSLFFLLLVACDLFSFFYRFAIELSVNQLQSTTPGLIAQLQGFLTKERYHFATVFVDHYSSLSFVYLQKTSNMEETLKAKETFERYAAIRGVLSCRQWSICRQRIHQSRPIKRSDDIILWLKCSSSEWCGRKTSSRSPRSRKNRNDTCQTKMARRHQKQPLAIRATFCEPCP